jgi:hypothetical protein
LENLSLSVIEVEISLYYHPFEDPENRRKAIEGETHIIQIEKEAE